MYGLEILKLPEPLDCNEALAVTSLRHSAASFLQKEEKRGLVLVYIPEQLQVTADDKDGGRRSATAAVH